MNSRIRGNDRKTMEEQHKEEIIAQYLEKDAEILKTNGLTEAQERLKNVNGEQGSIKSHYWKFIGGFFALLLIGFIGIPAVGQYMQKQEDAMRVEQIATNERLMNELQERLKNDKNGGATPEETLKLFTAALKKGDIEQAEKYFVIEPQERREMLIGRLEEIREEGKFETLLGYLNELDYMPKSSDEQVAIFRNLNKEGMADLSIEITKDKYSTVWKIESLMF